MLFDDETAQKMTDENERLKTFEILWPHSTPTALEMAKAGFYYLGISDKVRCAFCSVQIDHWDLRDTPMREHVKQFSNCLFIPRQKSKKLANLLACFRCQEGKKKSSP